MLTLDELERRIDTRISVAYYRGGSRLHTGTLLAVRELAWWERLFSPARFALTFGDPYPADVWIEADADLFVN